MDDDSKMSWLRIPRRLSVVFAIALAGCVPHSSGLQSSVEPGQAASFPDGRVCRFDPALLLTPRAPDCAFKRNAAKAMDPDEFSHLKVEHELRCYQNAEKAVRQRLRLLQAANKCQIASARAY